MHTRRYEDVRATIISNSDWSGNATIRWHEGGVMKEAHIPANILLSIGRGEYGEMIKREIDQLLEGIL